MISVHLCTARVVSSGDDQPVEVLLLDGSNQRLCPVFALPFYYKPAHGDLLTIIRSHDDRLGPRAWVIGTILARGTSHIAFRGDVKIGSVGCLKMVADGAFKLIAPMIKFGADMVVTIADVQIQRAVSSDTHVAGESEERSGATVREIEGEDLQLASRHVTMAGGLVKRDADLLQLG